MASFVKARNVTKIDISKWISEMKKLIGEGLELTTFMTLSLQPYIQISSAHSVCQWSNKYLRHNLDYNDMRKQNHILSSEINEKS